MDRFITGSFDGIQIYELIHHKIIQKSLEPLGFLNFKGIGDSFNESSMACSYLYINFAIKANVLELIELKRLP